MIPVRYEKRTTYDSGGLSHRNIECQEKVFQIASSETSRKNSCERSFSRKTLAESKASRECIRRCTKKKVSEFLSEISIVTMNVTTVNVTMKIRNRNPDKSAHTDTGRIGARVRERF